MMKNNAHWGEKHFVWKLMMKNNKKLRKLTAAAIGEVNFHKNIDWSNDIFTEKHKQIYNKTFRNKKPAM